ncbi:MAG: hypothetical protein AAF340_17060 [Pseudomonadota bacterium]
MTRFAPVLLLCVLGACATPEKLCIQDATKDLKIVQNLIATTEANLLRGYAVQTEERRVVFTDFCLGGRRSNVGVSFCNRSEPVTKRTPVAIDVAAERRKLRELKRREARLLEGIPAALKACEKV